MLSALRQIAGFPYFFFCLATISNFFFDLAKDLLDYLNHIYFWQVPATPVKYKRNIQFITYVLTMPKILKPTGRGKVAEDNAKVLCIMWCDNVVCTAKSTPNILIVHCLIFIMFYCSYYISMLYKLCPSSLTHCHWGNGPRIYEVHTATLSSWSFLRYKCYTNLYCFALYWIIGKKKIIQRSPYFIEKYQ